MTDEWGMSAYRAFDLSDRERRFIRAALWKSTCQLSVSSVCLLATSATALTAAVMGLGSRSMTGMLAAALISSVMLGIFGTLLVRERRRRMPDALVAINRCGCCGHSLKGARKTESRGVDIRTCCECGRNWTNLDRRISIDHVYQCI